MFRFVPPETRRLSVGDEGDWILVKKRLNAGESRKLFTGVIKSLPMNAPPELDPEKVGLQKLLVYLIDWSGSDHAPIRGRSPEEVSEALLGLAPDDFQAIVAAIDVHEMEMELEAEEEKKRRAGASALPAISPSVD